MSDKDSIMVHIVSECLAGAEDATISLPDNYIIIWMDYGEGGLLDTSTFTYAYLWKKVGSCISRFTNSKQCYSHIVSLRDREEKLFVIITDPKQPMVENDLFLLWSRLLIEPQVAKIYVIQTKLDLTFYRYWFQFKQHQKIYFIPNETLLLEQLRNNRNPNTIAICLETGTSEIFDIDKYGFNKLFSDATECFNYIISIRQQQMILVINSHNSQVFAYKIAISKLFFTKYYIYIFSTLAAIYILTSTRTKQIGIKQTDLFTNVGLFQNQLEQDISLDSPCLCNDEVISLSSTETLPMSLRSVSTERFFYYTNVIAKLPQTLEAKREMIQECRRYCQDKPTELERIDKFAYEYYEQKIGTAIWWYTQDSFVYRQLNEACRTEDIDLIYTFRNFISDLLLQLQKEHSTFYDDMFGMPVTVWRGQKMSIIEFNHLRKNVGKMYSTNTFLSATGDRKVALIFAGIEDQCPELESVLFEYYIDTSVETKRPYADIRLVSSKPSEQEVMFCMGTMYHIESVEQKEVDEENKKYTYWHVKMNLVSENDDVHLRSTTTEFKEAHQTTPILLSLGNLARGRSRVSNDCCKAERYYRLYLDEVLTANDEINYKSLIRAYKGLSGICRKKGDYAASIEYNEHIIRICLSHSSSSLNIQEGERINEILSSYIATGKIYQNELIDFDNAIKTYKELLEVLQRQDHHCLICNTQIINGIGDIFKKQARWSKATDFYRRAYVLNSDDSNYDRRHLDDAEEKLSKIQSRYPEVLFFLLLVVWCYSYSFGNFSIDEVILQNWMPVSMIRLINYHSVQYTIRKVTYANRRRLQSFDNLFDKIQKKLTNTRLQEQKERLFSRLYTIIPPFISLLTQQWFLYTDRNTLNKRTYIFILGTVLLAAYLPIIFLLITRIVMIFFIVTWLSALNIIHWSILIIPYYYCWKQISSLLLTYGVLLELDFQLAARQKREIRNVISKWVSIDHNTH